MSPLHVFKVIEAPQQSYEVGYYIRYFTQEENEAQKVEGTCPRSPRRWPKTDPEFKPRNVPSKHVFYTMWLK